MTVLAEDITFRELAGITELKRSEVLQTEVWGKDDKPDNADILLAIQHEGGLVAGAFHEERMLGFMFGFPSAIPGVQHSHRLAVHPDARGLGLGLRLKWFQRDWCLARGITLVRWTYDPLRAINAGLNIARLGATAGTYHIDYYGAMEGINEGLPSDRLLAEWQLDSLVVAQRAEGVRAAAADVENAALRIKIPANYEALIAGDLQAALAERLRVREEMLAAFAQGLRVTGYDNRSSCYLLNWE